MKGSAIVMSRSFTKGIRFLLVSAAVIGLGIVICNTYDISIIDALQQEVRNLNPLEEILSYYAIFDDKILRHINLSSLPFLYTFVTDNPEQGFLILLSETITINIIFSELYCRASGYDKHLYGKHVRFIFNLVGIISEFAITYCSYAFLVFLSSILPNNLGNSLLSNLSLDYSGDIKAAVFSQIKFLITGFGLACFIGVILIACLPNYCAIVITCIAALGVGLFSAFYNNCRPVFVLLGLFTRWFLGNADVSTDLRDIAFHFVFPLLFRLLILIIAYSVFVLVIAFSQ